MRFHTKTPRKERFLNRDKIYPGPDLSRFGLSGVCFIIQLVPVREFHRRSFFQPPGNEEEEISHSPEAGDRRTNTSDASKTTGRNENRPSVQIYRVAFRITVRGERGEGVIEKRSKFRGLLDDRLIERVEGCRLFQQEARSCNGTFVINFHTNAAPLMQLYPAMNRRDGRFDKANARLDSCSPRFSRTWLRLGGRLERASAWTNSIRSASLCNSSLKSVI